MNAIVQVSPKGPYTIGLVPNTRCYWELVEPLKGRVYCDGGRGDLLIFWACNKRAYWTLYPSSSFLLHSSFEVRVLPCHVLPPWSAASSKAQSVRTNQPKTETSNTVNQK